MDDRIVMIFNGELPTCGKGTCNGDSRGPLFVQGTTETVALVSFVCLCSKTHAFTTRVSLFQE
jgi:secreted trypsin-like serine protease